MWAKCKLSCIAPHFPLSIGPFAKHYVLFVTWACVTVCMSVGLTTVTILTSSTQTHICSFLRCYRDEQCNIQMKNSPCTFAPTFKCFNISQTGMLPSDKDLLAERSSSFLLKPMIKEVKQTGKVDRRKKMFVRNLSILLPWLFSGILQQSV